MVRCLKLFLFLSLWFVALQQSRADESLFDIDSLSEHSYISLITCDPGPELYAVFGHSAIGVVDPEHRLAVVFNYGTFSFTVPFFYAKFASGKLMYQLSVVDYRFFLREYEYRERMVTEEILNLSEYQKQKLFCLLKENYKPENREYQYDFFFDNCATRILDIFYEAMGDSLQLVEKNKSIVKTHRNLIDEYLTDNYWSDFGIDLALGAVIDKPATEREKTFLPDYLSEYINRCVVDGAPFVKGSRKLVKTSAVFKPTPWIIRPQVVFWIIFIVLTLLTILYRTKPWVIGDRIIFGVFGVLGLVVFLMWVATDHDATATNLNVLWANPLYLGYTFLIGSHHKQWLKWCTFILLFLNVFVLVGWNIIPQSYHIAFVPMIGILIIRSGVIALRYRK